MRAGSALIGREAECARLLELTEEHRLVTVTGPGGIGKTRLADSMAAAVVERQQVLRCELAHLEDRGELALTVAGELGRASLDEIADVVVAPTLLVLDNCEHLVPAIADVVVTLLDVAPALHVLATSREPLGLPDEHVLPLRPLALPASDDPSEMLAAPAVALLAERAQAAGASWSPTGATLRAMVEVCRRLDGIPLAIELAASRARSLTPTELVELLDRRLDLLWRRHPVGRARHASLRAALDASFDLLEPDEREVFVRLGVFAGPFSAELAHAVAGQPGADRLDTLDQLTRLVDRSLVVAGVEHERTVFELLETVRHYALEHLQREGRRQEAEERFVVTMVASADGFVIEGLQRWSRELMAALAAAFRNLVAAIHWCEDHDATPSRAFALLVPLWGVLHQARAGEVAAVGERVLRRWPATPDEDEPLRPVVTAVVASASMTAGRLPVADELAREALRLAGGEPLASLVAERVLAFLGRGSGDLDAAASHFRSAREHADRADVGALRRELALYEAWVCDVDGDLAGALGYMQAIRAEAAACDEIVNVERSHIMAAHINVQQGDFDAAAWECEQAAVALAAIEHPWGQSAIIRLEAVLAAHAGDLELAARLWQESLEVFVPHGDFDECSLVLRAAATRALRSGDTRTARNLVSACLRPAFELPLVHGPVDALASVTEAGPDGERIGMAEALQLACSLLASGAPSANAAPVARVERPRAGGVLARDGDTWAVAYGGREVRVRHMKGLADLAVLVASPDTEVHCLELMGASDTGAAGPALDDRARRDYQQRIRELQADLDEAVAHHDRGRTERAEAELDALVQQLTNAFGLGGKSRQSGSAVERARSAVTWRVRSAIKRIGEVHPELARHLGVAVRTGTWCSYRPEVPGPWDVRP